MGGSSSLRRVVRLQSPSVTIGKADQLLRAADTAGKEKRLTGQSNYKLDADLLTADDIEQLMRQCSRRAPTGVRNRALIAVCWRCGLRIGEVLALAVKDFDPDSGTLVVQRGKGGKRRVVGGIYRAFTASNREFGQRLGSPLLQLLPLRQSERGVSRCVGVLSPWRR
jgi:Phage integrase family